MPVEFAGVQASCLVRPWDGRAPLRRRRGDRAWTAACAAVKPVAPPAWSPTAGAPATADGTATGVSGVAAGRPVAGRARGGPRAGGARPARRRPSDSWPVRPRPDASAAAGTGDQERRCTPCLRASTERSQPRQALRRTTVTSTQLASLGLWLLFCHGTEMDKTVASSPASRTSALPLGSVSRSRLQCEPLNVDGQSGGLPR